MREFLVTCQQKTLEVQLEEDEDIEEKVKATFGLASDCEMSMEHFSAKWKKWLSVEVCRFAEIPSLTELRATVSTTVTVINNAPLNADILLHQSTQKEELSTPNSVTLSPLTTTPMSIQSWTSDANSPNRALRLPRPFLLPIEKLGLQGPVLNKLQHERDLDQSDRRKILDAIYNYVTSTYSKMYFTRTEYHDIVDAFLRTYPYIPASEGYSSQDALDVWHGRLVNKSKNTRRRYGRDHPDVAQRIASSRKRKLEVDAPGTENVKRPKLHHGVANFLPPNMEGEDDTTLSIHETFLKKQSRLDKTLRDTEKVRSKMTKTFSARRWMVVMKATPITEMRERYPILFCEDQIIEEYHRITEKHLGNDWEKGLETYIRPLSMLPTSKNEAPLLRSARERITETDAAWTVGLLCLPSHLRENICDIITTGSPRETAGCIHIQRLDGCILDITAFYVFMDGAQVAVCSTLPQAWMVLMAASYVFNIVYPKDQNSTMNFCQRMLLNINDSTSKNVKLVKLLGRIKKSNK